MTAGVLMFALVLPACVICTFFVTRKISSSKLSQLMKERCAWYESMLDAIPFPISVTDNNMNWTFLNAPAEKVTGLKRGDIIGKQCSNWGADICKTDRCGIQMLRSGKPTSFFTQPGIDMDFQVDAGYLKDLNGNTIGNIEVVQDISSRTRVTDYQKIEADNLSNTLAGIASGDLTKRYTPSAGNQYTTEVSGVFQKISQAIEAMRTNLSEVIENLAKSASIISSNSEESSTASSQVASAIEELNASFSEVSRMFQDELKMVRNSSETMQQIQQSMSELQASAKEITKVSEVIGDIADQTNLLALNATIEAASAGDAGKGFAVVATEVKELAKQTAESTRVIENLIATVTSHIESSVNQVQSITGIIGDLNSATLSLSSSVEEQSVTLQEIAKTAAQTKQGAGELAQLSSTISGLAGKFKV